MTISVIIPVFNEQNTINSAVSRLNDCEIVVSDCNGRTLDVISSEQVIKVMTLKGRGIQMNKGAEAATGDILLFLHCDTKLPEDWQKSVIKIMETSDYGAFLLGIDSNRPIFRIIEFFSNIRCRLTKIPYGDQAIFMKKEYFQGYKHFHIFEDFRLMQDAKFAGLKFGLINKKVKTSARRWEKEGVLFTTLRNWYLTLRYISGTHPDNMKSHYGDTR